MRNRDGVGADVLGDAAGFFRRDVGFTDHVEQGGLAMIDVSHDGDHRRPQLQFFGLVFDIDLRPAWAVRARYRAALTFLRSKRKPYLAHSF